MEARPPSCGGAIRLSVSVQEVPNAWQSHGAHGHLPRSDHRSAWRGDLRDACGDGDSASAQTDASTWARTYHGDDSVFGKGIMRMPDGDLVVMGTLSDRLLVTRLTPDGDVRWSMTYGRDVAGGVSGDIAPYGVPCSPSGMLVCWERTLFRLNDSGTVRWARNYRIYAAIRFPAHDQVHRRRCSWPTVDSRPAARRARTRSSCPGSAATALRSGPSRTL